MQYDAKGREINEQWFREREAEYKQNYKDHYLPQKLKAKGVFKRYGKWVANIKYFGHSEHLGTYETREEAEKVFREAQQEFIDNFDEYWQIYYQG